jgi:hypothetical protein
VYLGKVSIINYHSNYVIGLGFNSFKGPFPEARRLIIATLQLFWEKIWPKPDIRIRGDSTNDEDISKIKNEMKEKVCKGNGLIETYGMIDQKILGQVVCNRQKQFRNKKHK